MVGLRFGNRTTAKYGKSPGAGAESMPLHIVHSIALYNPDPTPIRLLRLFAIKSAVGWGVSVWQLDVFGYEIS